MTDRIVIIIIIIYSLQSCTNVVKQGIIQCTYSCPGVNENGARDWRLLLRVSDVTAGARVIPSRRRRRLETTARR